MEVVSRATRQLTWRRQSLVVAVCILTQAGSTVHTTTTTQWCDCAALIWRKCNPSGSTTTTTGSGTEHAGSTAAKMDFRCVLIRDLKNMWPSGITVDGMVLDNLHLGRSPDHEVQGGIIQFASCAAGRVVHHAGETCWQLKIGKLQEKPAGSTGRGRGACRG